MDREKKEILTITSDFKYLDFYQNKKFSDCKVIVPNKDGSTTTIDAHILILSNSSEFFYNVFTSGMQESQNGIVNITVNPQDLFPKVIEYFYTGELLIEKPENILDFLEISIFYSIEQLKQKLITFIRENLDVSNLLLFTDYCQTNEYVNAMIFFYSIYVEMYKENKITIDDMSQTLTCSDFAQIIKGLKLSNSEAIPLITQFYGTYEGSPEEKMDLLNSLDTSDRSLRRTLHNLQPAWVPPQFYQ